MSKVADQGRVRLRERVLRLHRLLDLEAPDLILANEAFMVAEAAQMLDLGSWLSREESRLRREHKSRLNLCQEDDCEEVVAWMPGPSSGLMPGPFHAENCTVHAAEAEAEMRADDEDEEGTS